MPFTPGEQRALAEELRRIYDKVELDILEKIAALLAKGADDDHSWAYRRLADTQAINKAVQQIIRDIDAGMEVEVTKAVTQAYNDAAQEVDHDMYEAGMDVSGTRLSSSVSFEGASTRAISALTQATVTSMRGAHLMIVRSANDAYRRVVHEASASMLAGNSNLYDAMQESLNRFADQGVTGFIDKAGRRWSLGAYSEMSLRTTTAHAAVEGTIDRVNSVNLDLVVVSNHPKECNMCRPWEGRVLSTSDDDTRYPSLRSATSSGLFHPNCGHTVTAYLPGYTQIPTNTEDPAGEAHRAREKYLERGIRKWQKRMSVAVDPQTKKETKAKFTQWTKAYNDHRSKSPALPKVNYHREPKPV